MGGNEGVGWQRGRVPDELRGAGEALCGYRDPDLCPVAARPGGGPGAGGDSCYGPEHLASFAERVQGFSVQAGRYLSFLNTEHSIFQHVTKARKEWRFRVCGGFYIV
jgi:hypothetical protein